MFEVFLIIPNSNNMGLLGILNFYLLRDGFSYRLVSGIHLKEGVPWPLQSMVRTPAPELR